MSYLKDGFLKEGFPNSTAVLCFLQLLLWGISGWIVVIRDTGTKTSFLFLLVAAVMVNYNLNEYMKTGGKR